MAASKSLLDGPRYVMWAFAVVSRLFICGLSHPFSCQFRDSDETDSHPIDLLDGVGDLGFNGSRRRFRRRAASEWVGESTDVNT